MNDPEAAPWPDRLEKSELIVPDSFNRLTGAIIGHAIEVHRSLGPGLLESVYSRCLEWELRAAGHEVVPQMVLPVRFRSVTIQTGFRADLVVSSGLGTSVVVEMKAVEALEPVHRAQLLTYLRLLDLPVGLVLNFNTCALKDGVIRMLNNRWSGPSTEGIASPS
jgi:GxxExxY protein